jgi:hypothetical protein
VIIFFLVLTF